MSFEFEYFFVVVALKYPATRHGKKIYICEATSLMPKPIALTDRLSDVARDGAIVGDAQGVVTGSCNDDRPSSPSPTCTRRS